MTDEYGTVDQARYGTVAEARDRYRRIRDRVEGKTEPEEKTSAADEN